jgi:hypothetical protein
VRFEADVLRITLSLFFCAALLLTAGFAVAGTTGILQGRVIDSASGRPLGGVRVSVASPSQPSISMTADGQGFFRFASLGPDAYVVSGVRAGYAPATVTGVRVVADQSVAVELVLQPLRVIGATRSQMTLRASTVAGMTSFSADRARTLNALAGPGGYMQAYGAMNAVPGVFSPQGQTGWYQTLYIRGGDQDQAGYEYDGIPVARRDWQNSPLVNFSRLGLQELDVYTGAIPATSDATGISGYVNQVVKSGTAPAYETFSATAG